MIDVPTRVKDALKKGTYRKNWKMIVLKDDGSADFTINNDYLVKDTVKLDERMCSGDELKFGLCEGSSLEFQYFDKPNIKGRRIQAKLEIEYKTADGELDWYEMPMGFFDVSQCPRQFDTGIMKVTAFNKLKSDYLDAEAKADVTELIEAGESGVANKISLHTLLGEMLEGYSIQRKIYNGIKTQFTGARSYDVVTAPRCDATGALTGSYEQIFVIQIEMPLSKNDFYRFEVFGENIKENARRLWERGKGTTVSLNGVKYTLEQASKTIYNFGWALTGSYRENVITEDRTNLNSFGITIPVYMSTGVQDPTITESIINSMNAGFNNLWKDFEFGNVYELELSDIEKQKLTMTDVESIQNVTLRDLQSAVYEMNCQYGQLDRETDLFSGVELNHSRLLPSGTLYPKNDLYPMASSERANASMYQKLWTDSGSQKKFKYLIITYKGTDSEGKEIERTLQRTVNADGNVNYNMSDNWLFKNLVWTADQVGEFADAMVEKMRDVSWIPFEMWSAGLPYLETGDELEIKTNEGTAVSYILTRQLTGIHNLMDTYTNGTLDIF